MALLRLSPGARVEHEETLRILRRPFILRLLRARKLKETEIWQRPRGREGHRPFAPWRVENSNSISKLLLPSTIYLVLNLAAHPGVEEGAPVCGSVGSDAGQGEQAGEAREGEEYKVEEILNKRVAKGSGSAKSRTEYLVSWKGGTTRRGRWRTWRAAPSSSARTSAR